MHAHQLCVVITRWQQAAPRDTRILARENCQRPSRCPLCRCTTRACVRRSRRRSEKCWIFETLLTTSYRLLFLQEVLASADDDQVRMMEERVILTDYYDNPIGNGSKKDSEYFPACLGSGFGCWPASTIAGAH